jgi:transcriptional regulator with XRE-family HTH domain
MPDRRRQPKAVKESETLFGRAFSQLRADVGVSTYELSEAVGYHSRGGGAANISKYERGDMLPPQPETIIEWMAVLGYPEDAVETRSILGLAAQDHHRAIDQDYLGVGP